MALISTLDRSGFTHMSKNGTVQVPYRVEFDLNFATALTAKGSALAAADVIECIYIPAGTVVMGAGIANVVVADSTTLTLHVGTGVDNDEWAASFDAKGAVGTYGADLDSVPSWNTYAAADTIDVTLATLTGTLTTGKVRVYALLLDVSNLNNNPGIALVGS